MYKDLVKDREIYSLQTPKTFVPSPTSDDYDNGFIQRYFCQKANDTNGFVYELDENEYEITKSNPYWITAEMRWRITGPINTIYSDRGKITDLGVISSNSASIAITSSKIKNIGLYLPNLVQYHK